MQYFKFFIQSTVYGDTERYQISYRKLFAKTVIYRTTENRCCISKSLHRQRYCEEKDTALEVFRTDRGLRKHREIDAVPEVLRRDCSLQIHRKTDTVLFLSAFFQQSTAVGSSSLDPGIYVTIANADPLFMRSFTVSSRTPPPPRGSEQTARCTAGTRLGCLRSLDTQSPTLPSRLLEARYRRFKRP